MPSIKRENFVLYIIIAVFALIYSSISLVNHYLFRTYALDLGLYNNAIYYYSKLKFVNNGILDLEYSNLLSAHFELYPFFISPLRWIFGSYTLLIFQIASILFGGYGAYKYIFFKSGSKKLSIIAMIHFFSIWGIFSALGFDYHNNVIAAMLVPWFFLAFDKRNFRTSGFIFILILFGKENMALWGSFIALGLMLLNLKDKIKLRLPKQSIFFSIKYVSLLMSYILY